MKNHDRLSNANTESLRCPSCDREGVRTTIQHQSFVYGEGDDAATLAVAVPVHTCDNCGLQFTDDSAATARHDAVCRHLNVMTPSEVQALRERYDMSRAEFSRLTRIGEASLGRWENGLLIQNHAYDQFLFLLKFPENVARLRDRTNSEAPAVARPGVDSEPVAQPRLRILREIPSRLAREARVFVLRPAAAVAGTT
jgi:putative zinc finger/helix-turn-helix YgiT family protein